MKDVLFVMLPGTLLLDMAGPAEAFRLANQRLQQRGQRAAYRLRFVGPQAQAGTSVGVALAGIEALPSTVTLDALVVLLGQPTGAESPLQRPLPRAWTDTRRWLARVVAPHLAAHAAHAALATTAPGVRVMTVCAGALLAADAGLIGTRRCTTHHEMLDTLHALACKTTASL
jgi:transcriptional regulator GlxA family with amidase domain